MSTAGKVLAVLVLLTSLVWMALAAGVAQLNTNGNQRLHDLVVQIEKLQDDLQETQNELTSVKDQTSTTQERTDRELAALRARQSDIEKARSQIRESLSRAQYQLAIVQETIKGAQDALQHRNEEYQTEEKALADLKSDVGHLVADTNSLRERLTTLRTQFHGTYHTNVEMLGNKTR